MYEDEQSYPPTPTNTNTAVQSADPSHKPGSIHKIFRACTLNSRSWTKFGHHVGTPQASDMDRWRSLWSPENLEDQLELQRILWMDMRRRNTETFFKPSSLALLYEKTTIRHSSARMNTGMPTSCLKLLRTLLPTTKFQPMKIIKVSNVTLCNN
jgi:hypothetical protein